MIFSGRRLLVNCDGSAGGTGAVELLDGEGQPVAGCRLDACNGFAANSLSREITWKGVDDLGALAGTPVRLRFEMKGLRLFAFRFAE